MKQVVYVWLVCLFASLFTGCGDDVAVRSILESAESVYKRNPDSSLVLFHTIGMPDAFQLRRALAYYQKEGTAEEQAKIGLFLGRSYVEDHEYEKAMSAYLPALDLAVKASNDHLTGSISYAMGDLYFLKGRFGEAAQKYKAAAARFHKTGDAKAYAFALRDESECYYKADSIEAAFTSLRQAAEAVEVLADPAEQSYIYYILGNAYGRLDSIQLAEDCQWISVRLDSIDPALSYLALSEIYRIKGDLPRARKFIGQALEKPSEEQDLPALASYQSYLTEKAAGNAGEALAQMEHYLAWKDSTYAMRSRMHTLEIEKKYDHQKAYLENMQLKVGRQRMVLWLFVLVMACLVFVVIYQFMIRFKNAEISRQRELVAQKDIRLLKLSLDLKKRKADLEQLSASLSNPQGAAVSPDSYRKQVAAYEEKQEEIQDMNAELLHLKQEKLQITPIAKKLQRLSAQVVPGAGESLLSEDDWVAIRDTVDEVYHPLVSILRSEGIELTPAEQHYCYLTFFTLSTNREAILLNIAPDSVVKGRQRLRQKLGISGGKTELYEYLTTLL